MLAKLNHLTLLQKQKTIISQQMFHKIFGMIDAENLVGLIERSNPGGTLFDDIQICVNQNIFTFLIAKKASLQEHCTVRIY